VRLLRVTRGNQKWCLVPAGDSVTWQSEVQQADSRLVQALQIDRLDYMYEEEGPSARWYPLLVRYETIDNLMRPVSTLVAVPAGQRFADPKGTEPWSCSY
jgi:hypothetical protein